MYLLKLLLIIHLSCEYWCKLEAIPENIRTIRVSLAKCVGEVANLFFGNGDLTLVGLSTVKSIYVPNSSASTDTLLLMELFNRSSISLIIKKLENATFNESYIKKIDNYIIHIKLTYEISETLQILKSFTSWNPLARFLIVSPNNFREPQAGAQAIIEQLWQRHIMNAVVLLVNANDKLSFSAYSWFPYSTSLCTNNNNEVLEIDQCNMGKFKIGSNWYPNKIPKNLNNCSLRVQAIVWPPYVLPPNDDGAFTDGVEIKIINTMAEKANFTVNYLTSNTTWGFILANGTAVGAMFMLQNEECDILVGSCSATLERHRYFDQVVYNFPESLTWCVPHARDAYQWIKLFMVLPGEVIMLNYFLCLVLSIMLWRFCRLNPAEATSYKTLASSWQNVMSVYFNTSVHLQPRSLKARFLFMLWVLLILHITALYQSSLISVLTKPNYKQQIKSFPDLLDSNLNIRILTNMRRFFAEENEVNRKVKSMWNICENIERCLYDTSVSKKSATATPRLYLKYAVNHYVTNKGEPLLYCFKDSIVTFPLEMLFYKGFPLREYFEVLIGRIVSAGLISHWEKQIFECQLKHKSYDIQHPGDYQLAMSHLILIFIILFFGYLFGFIILLIELYVHNKKKKLEQKK